MKSCALRTVDLTAVLCCCAVVFACFVLKVSCSSEDRTTTPTCFVVLFVLFLQHGRFQALQTLARVRRGLLKPFH